MLHHDRYRSRVCGGWKSEIDEVLTRLLNGRGKACSAEQIAGGGRFRNHRCFTRSDFSLRGQASRTALGGVCGGVAVQPAAGGFTIVGVVFPARAGFYYNVSGKS